MSEPLQIPTATSVTGELPDGLLAAFAGYENALATNDLTALDAYFAPGENTLRGDATGLLVGHDAISGFRGARTGTVARGIRQLHVRVIDPRHALIVSVNTPDAGGAGLVTQLWSLGDADAWQVEVAQVAAPPAAINPTVWRLVGAPLVGPDPDVTGPLSGESIAVKDLYDIAGFTVGAGNPAYLREAVPATETAPAVAALLAAGASVRGIAQTDEFAYSIAGDNEHYGTPPNVRVPGGLPGGSSSGPAAAVALGQASIGLATDTAGSIRVPASYQGLWGLRSSHGAVDRTGLLPLAPSFDTVGWLTREPGVLRAAAAASLDLSRQLDPRPQPDAPARFAVSAALVFAANDDVQAAFVTGLDRLTGAGLLPEPDLVDVGDLAEALRIFRTVQAAEAWRANGDWVRAHPGALGAAVASRFEAAARTDPDEEAQARVDLAAARARLDAVLDGRILLLPSASSTAPPRRADPAAIDATRTATLSMTSLAGIGGYPALSVPLFEAVSVRGVGAPVGLCLVGPRHTDLALIDIGAELFGGR